MLRMANNFLFYSVFNKYTVYTWLPVSKSIIYIDIGGKMEYVKKEGINPSVYIIK